MKTLDEYFKKSISEAYKSENRDIDWSKIRWFYVIVDKQILFSVKTPYARVSRRIEYRINSNVLKNFGLNNNGDFALDTILQPNFVCNKFEVDRRNYYLIKNEDYKYMRTGEVMPSYRYERLCMAYHGLTIDEFREKVKKEGDYHLPHNMQWNLYRETYHKALGKYPEVEISDMSSNVELA